MRPKKRIADSRRIFYGIFRLNPPHSAKERHFVLTAAALGGKGGELLDVQGKSSMLYRKVQAVQPLLEIPQLIDACIRAEAFDEALDLQACHAPHRNT